MIQSSAYYYARLRGVRIEREYRETYIHARWREAKHLAEASYWSHQLGWRYEWQGCLLFLYDRDGTFLAKYLKHPSENRQAAKMRLAYRMLLAQA